ncbi:hypothetical protein [Brunnivagina elsteri]|uniref:hypothetical protein n=1 Tax=Brunnivagina elsteri TaxID=1247191 RepID=UPI0013043778|nr:hypothetical protein [Calothrix elsteri]
MKQKCDKQSLMPKAYRTPYKKHTNHIRFLQYCSLKDGENCWRSHNLICLS